VGEAEFVESVETVSANAIIFLIVIWTEKIKRKYNRQSNGILMEGSLMLLFLFLFRIYSTEN
jgi:hypothetical protein